MSGPSALWRVDAHQHFWRPARGDYRWLDPSRPGLAPLLRDFLPEHLAPLRAAAHVTQTVLVQAADAEAETDFMLDLAERDPSIGGVVGWVDLSSAQCVPQLEAWAEQPKFKGVRPMLQDLPQADWIARAPHPDAVRALLRLGLRLDALVRPEHLPHLLAFVRAWPGLPVVIDHAAKPPLALGTQGTNGDWVQPWRRGLAELAALPQVCCKFSGLLTEMSPAQRATRAAAQDVLGPVWDTLVGCFEPRRLMWGSDWPVLTLATGYDAWLSLAASLIAELSPDEHAQVWRGSACRFYGLREEEPA